MAISKSKRRYTVTLTPSNVDRFHDLCRRLGLPPSTMSNACDDIINNLSDTFQMALDKGTMEIGDLFIVMGKQMQLLHEEEKKEVSKNGRSKRNTDTQRKK